MFSYIHKLVKSPYVELLKIDNQNSLPYWPKLQIMPVPSACVTFPVCKVMLSYHAVKAHGKMLFHPSQFYFLLQ